MPQRTSLRTRVLVVEDQPLNQNLYKDFFETRHKDEFSWILSTTGEAAVCELKKHSHSPIDVALIDWHLENSELSGFQILEFIRSNPETRAILAFMVTGNDRDQEIDAAFAAGADDYIVKPYRPQDLLNRLRSHLRERERNLAYGAHKSFQVDGLYCDPLSGQVALNGKRITLHPTEFALLSLFLQRPDQILSQAYLWEKLRGYESKTSTKALLMQISNLRKRLGAWGARIETFRDMGYLLNTKLPVPQD